MGPDWPRTCDPWLRCPVSCKAPKFKTKNNYSCEILVKYIVYEMDEYCLLGKLFNLMEGHYIILKYNN